MSKTLLTTTMKMLDVSFNIVLLAGILCSLVDLTTARGSICYECQRMSHPRDCNNVVQCSEHQVCTVERFVTSDAHFYYNSGCRLNTTCHSHVSSMGRRILNTKALIGSPRSGSLSQYPDCAACCDADYCNTNICDPFPHTSTLKRCFSCDEVENLSDCHTIRGCDQDEMCYTTFFLNTFGEKRFRLGCMRKTECAASASGSYGRKRANLPNTRYCTECCVDHHCNRNACKNASTVLPKTTWRTTKPTSAVLCEDNPGSNCTNAILPYICPNPSFGQLCKKSCGFCGGGSGVVVPVTTSSPMTSLPPISGECKDDPNQSCTPEILPIICYDDVTKYFCKKSCRACEATLPPVKTCADTDVNMCRNSIQSMCANKELAHLLCPQSCGLCHGAVVTSTANPPVNTGPCVDNDIRCFDVNFLSTACWDSKQRNLCQKSCGLCVH